MLLAKISFLPPTTTIYGSRYKATVKEGSFKVSATVKSTYSTDNKDELRAVEALCDKLEKAPHGFFKYGVAREIKILGSYDNDVYASIFPIRQDS
jgi:hypothetical protein